MAIGRPRFNLTSRTCKRCGLVCPIEMFQVAPTPARPNGTIRTLCDHCWRIYRNEHNGRRYDDPEFREMILERNRQYQRNRLPEESRWKRNHRVSQHMWIKLRCEAVDLLSRQRVIVYLGRLDPHPHVHPSAERPWKGRHWAIRSIQAGMVPPAHSMPLFRLEHGVATAHPLCGEEWRWVAPMVQQWINRNKETDDAD